MSKRENAFAQTSFRAHGVERLERLCQAVGLADKSAPICRLFTRMIAPWGEDPVGRTPRWPSDIGDDHSPYEFSVSFGGAPELRILVEAMGRPATLASNRDAALALTDLLARECEADRRRLDAIQDLFLPEQPQGQFVIWHAVSFWPDRGPEVKVYFNPQCRGRHLAPALIEEALVRLGFAKAYGQIARTAGLRGPWLDEYKYLSVDLAAHAAARVKVYVRHHRPTFDDLERAASAASSYRPGEVTAFTREITGIEGDTIDARPLATCHNFLAECGERPVVATTHVPVSAYAGNDEIAAERIARGLGRFGLPEETYRKVLAASAWRPLSDGIGMQSYASFKRHGDRVKVTVYFPPELYAPGRQPEVWRPEAPRTASQVLENLASQPITEHPLFQRLRRGEPNPTVTYQLLRNLEIGLVDDAARGIAEAAARAPDDRLRGLLARRLNSLLGEGMPERAYRHLFQSLLAELTHARPAVENEGHLQPGLGLRERLASLYDAEDPLERIGAALAVETMSKQVDLWLCSDLRRHRSGESSDWLDVTRELAGAVADDGVSLTRLITPPARFPLWRGADAAARALWTFCDDFYQVCLP
jgi:DMATS type aromatic prenyltransferase